MAADSEDSPATEDAPIGQAALAQAPPTGLPTGTLLRDYEIRSVIGENDFGLVYMAWDRYLHRRVAVKAEAAFLKRECR
jgi:serine/threonine protein kinase